MKTYVGIRQNGQVYNLALLGNMADGGFYVSDLYPYEAQAYVSKTKFPANNHGLFKSTIDKKQQWVTVNYPKLSHHIDGRAQVSGQGIISGFYKLSGRAKGVHVQSMDLSRNDNDGGPIFTFMVWGLEEFNSPPRSNQVIFEENEILEGLPNDTAISGYLIEGYYFSKSLEGWVDPISGIIIKTHPHFGDLKLKRVLSNNAAPGFLGIACFKITHGFPDKVGCIINGGPGATTPDGMFETIWIMRPALKFFIDKPNPRYIDINNLRKIVYKVEADFASIITRLKYINETLKDVSSWPKFIAIKLLKRKLNKAQLSDFDVKKIFYYLHILLQGLDLDSHKTLSFYATSIGKPVQLNDSFVAWAFQGLSDKTQTPLQNRKMVELELDKICSLENLKTDMEALCRFYKLHISAAQVQNLTRYFKQYILHNPIIIRNIPNSITQTNIQRFVLTQYSPIRVPYPNTLYSLTYLFSSDFPLSIVVKGSIE